MTTQDDLIKTFIEIRFKERNDFLKIRETLERVGIASRKDNTLYQSVHILHKKGQYYLVHFKEMFALDGKDTDFSEEDRARRNRIAALIEEWIPGVEIVSQSEMLQPMAAMNHIKVIAYKDKPNWKLESKYSMGGRRNLKRKIYYVDVGDTPASVAKAYINYLMEKHKWQTQPK